MPINVNRLPKGTAPNQALIWDNAAGVYVNQAITTPIVTRTATTPTATTEGLPQLNQELVNQELDARIKANKLLTFPTTVTGVATPAQQTAFPIGIIRNPTTGEVWEKTSEGTVTKIEDLKSVCVLSTAQNIGANGFYTFTHSLNDLNPSITAYDGAGVVLVNQPNIAFTVVDANNVRVDIGSVPVTGFKMKVCGGAVVTYVPSPLGAVTNALGSNVNTMTSTVNGSPATAPIVNANVVTLTGQTLSTTVNGVISNTVTLPNASAINTNLLSLSGSNLTSTVNGVASNSITLPSGTSTNTLTYVPATGILTSNVNSVSQSVNIPFSNARIDKIIPCIMSGNYVVNPAVDAPTQINPDGRASWIKGYNGNFTGPSAVTALAADEAYLVNVTHHYRVTSNVFVPGFVRARVDFLAGGLTPINPNEDSQDSADMFPTDGIQLNNDKTVSKWYYGESALSYFKQQIEIDLPNTSKATYPAITIQEQKMELIVYIVKKNTYISTPIVLY